MLSLGLLWVGRWTPQCRGGGGYHVNIVKIDTSAHHVDELYNKGDFDIFVALL